jgi:hypothetical protein
MPEFLNGDAEIIQPGVYQLVYNSDLGTGTGALTIQKDPGATPQPMTDGTFTVNEDRLAYLGGGRYGFTLTGDARIWIDRIT